MSTTLDAHPAGRAGSHGVCAICHGDSRDYPTCYSCADNINKLSLGENPPRVLPLGLAMKGEALAIALWNYKRGDTAAVRSRAVAELRRFIDTRIVHVLKHADAYDTICHVPGRRGPGHPVRELFAGTDWGRSQHFSDLLGVRDREIDTHTPDPHRFEVLEPVRGQRILVLEDTYTRGATSLSAAHALLAAGAGSVTIVVIGRHADYDWLSAEFLTDIRARKTRGEFCPTCSHPLAQVRRNVAALDVDRPAGEPDLWAARMLDKPNPRVQPIPTVTPPKAADLVPTPARKPNNRAAVPSQPTPAAAARSTQPFGQRVALALTVSLAIPLAVLTLLDDWLREAFNLDPLSRERLFGIGDLGTWLQGVAFLGGLAAVYTLFATIRRMFAILVFIVLAFTVALFATTALDAGAGHETPTAAATTETAPTPDHRTPRHTLDDVIRDVEARAEAADIVPSGKQVQVQLIRQGVAVACDSFYLKGATLEQAHAAVDAVRSQPGYNAERVALIKFILDATYRNADDLC